MEDQRPCHHCLLSQVSNGSLVLANVTELDEGNYTCQAVNNGGTAEAHIRIDVLEGLAAGQGTWVDGLME